ncbi:MAG: hypothetical protein CME06_06880 [Gemmatimonadetes bacterium]|nr:hypothetical protein [Gemmatimonadota bacterium]
MPYEAAHLFAGLELVCAAGVLVWLARGGRRHVVFTLLCVCYGAAISQAPALERYLLALAPLAAGLIAAALAWLPEGSRKNSLSFGIPSAPHLRPIGEPRKPRSSADTPPVSELTDRPHPDLRYRLDRLPPSRRGRALVEPPLMQVDMESAQPSPFDVLSVVVSMQTEPWVESARGHTERGGDWVEIEDATAWGMVPKLRIYWRSRGQRWFHLNRSVATPLFIDGEAHRYELGMAGVPEWTGSDSIRAIGVDLVPGKAWRSADPPLEWIVAEFSTFELGHLRSETMLYNHPDVAPTDSVAQPAWKGALHARLSP